MEGPFSQHLYDGGQRKVGRADTKRRNRQTVLNLVASSGTTTRAELARTIGLTRATISSLVAELISEELVVEVGRAEPEVGKPPTLIELNSASNCLMCVDLSARPFIGAVVDLTGRVVGAELFAPQSGHHQRDLDALVKQLRESTDRNIGGIGIASPGVITDRGLVVEATNLGWRDHDVASLTAEAADLPVTVINDSRACAVGAYTRLMAEISSAESASLDLLLIQIGYLGVGAGLILDRRVHFGVHRAAGEIGHVVVDPHGEPCHCGNNGCLETVASVAAICARFGGDAHALTDLSAARTQFGLEAVDTSLAAAGQAIGSTLGVLINALDVQLVVIAMQPLDAAAAVASSVEDTLGPLVLPSLRSEVQVTTMDNRGLAMAGVAAVTLAERFGLAWN